MLKVTTIKGTKVLTNGQGMTLYYFAPDTSTKSACNAKCLKFWPAEPAPATAGTGVTGTIGMIMTHGKEQATYDGHPLYTYVGDTAPGQAKGNLLNAAGGLWYEMTVNGAMPAGAGASTAPSSGSSSGGGSGGYGY
jgi:predicted lipoprotein with Yx(FWY)xxD motif